MFKFKTDEELETKRSVRHWHLRHVWWMADCCRSYGYDLPTAFKMAKAILKESGYQGH